MAIGLLCTPVPLRFWWFANGYPDCPRKGIQTGSHILSRLRIRCLGIRAVYAVQLAWLVVVVLVGMHVAHITTALG